MDLKRLREILKYSEDADHLASQIVTFLLRDEPDVMRIRDVVKVLGIGKNAIDKWIVLGRLKVIRSKGHIYIAKTHLVTYLSSVYFRGSQHRNDFRKELLELMEIAVITEMKKEEANG